MARILLIADNHYDKHCGHQLIPAWRGHQLTVAEDDTSPLERLDLVADFDLLVLHYIAGTCGNELPGEAAETRVRAWVDAGKPLLLLHGSSAAFWHWPWWRQLVGWRWVRPNDPTGVPASTHPVRPYRVEVSKCAHPLTQLLQPLDLPSDEIYINLEQVCPCWTLMHTTTDEGTFPMAHLHYGPAGGAVLGFLPGHAVEVTSSPQLHTCIRTLSDWLLEHPCISS